MNRMKTPVLKIAPPYDEALIRRIEEGFTERLGADIHFLVDEDPSLLCGFIAYVNGMVYDTSGKARLADIGEHLLDALLTPLAAKDGNGFS